jgi:integrase
LWKDPGLVFATVIGTPLELSNVVSRSFKRLLERAGVTKITFHGLRHSCASLLGSQGVPIKVIQEVLGHSSIAVTMDVYSHVLPDMQQAASAMDALLFDR